MKSLFFVTLSLFGSLVCAEPTQYMLCSGEIGQLAIRDAEECNSNILVSFLPARTAKGENFCGEINFTTLKREVSLRSVSFEIVSVSNLKYNEPKVIKINAKRVLSFNGEIMKCGFTGL